MDGISVKEFGCGYLRLKENIVTDAVKEPSNFMQMIAIEIKSESYWMTNYQSNTLRSGGIYDEEFGQTQGKYCDRCRQGARQFYAGDRYRHYRQRTIGEGQWALYQL